jgi:hypothetical protein
LLAAVLHTDVRVSAFAEDGEGEVLHVRLHFVVVELTADKSLGIEHARVKVRISMTKKKIQNVRVGRVHCDLIFCSIPNETLVVGERDVGWGGTVTVVVGDDLNTIVLPDTDATAEES